MVQHELTTADNSQLAERLSSLDMPAERIQQAEEDARRHVERIDRILAVGEHFNPDEVLLVLTLREELAAFAVFLDRRFNTPAALGLEEVDRQIMQKIGRMKLSGKSARLFADFIRRYRREVDRGE